MSEWRHYDTPCPIDEAPVSWVKCGDCPFFRGMSQYADNRKINCNWPRNGSEVYVRPLPAAFTEADWDDGAA